MLNGTFTSPLDCLAMLIVWNTRARRLEFGGIPHLHAEQVLSAVTRLSPILREAERSALQVMGREPDDGYETAAQPQLPFAAFDVDPQSVGQQPNQE